MSQQQQRLNYAQQAPELFKKYVEFSMALKKGTLGAALHDLVTLRASQLNGCAFCVDMHVKEATLHGERALRLHHMAVWHESPLFSPRERAALAWVELLTKLPPQGVHETDFQAVREHFSEPELAELSFAIVGINGWNRLAIGFAAVPGSQDKAFGLDKAGLA
ncbi:carboxymuconolactone decarboxylase family protein [Paucibacter sp. XJ19-41]|uniref:carboxymuconolactone decarboxylase family protein n=1 Tax=Paucibacter sp. XJ19-41 TaxID=2927824 RepID=UPI002349EDF1|nr:carboxymuconolactone decarboxylase family protein [Paucibacter sp. XJ19-41]MDC6167635.1 carboxymuconolactone decarboxylase family protein [Paucibacter sp. XJ19-41]